MSPLDLIQDPTQLVSGELAGSASAVQMPDIGCRAVNFIAEIANAGNVYIGFTSGVTKAAGTTNATCGYELDGGVATGWVPCHNLNQLWRICDNAGDDLTYIAIK